MRGVSSGRNPGWAPRPHDVVESDYVGELSDSSFSAGTWKVRFEVPLEREFAPKILARFSLHSFISPVSLNITDSDFQISASCSRVWEDQS